VVWRLVRDQIWRLRGGWIACGALVATFWLCVADGASDATLPMALSLLLVALGLVAGLVELMKKELRVLPVSRRQRGQACWTMGIAFPVAVTSTGRAIALLVAPLVTSTSPLRAETLVLSTLCDIAFLGIVGGILVLFTRPPSRVPTGVARSIEIVAGIAFLGSLLGGEFLLRPYLPVRWTDLAGVPAVVMAAGIGMAARGYFYALRSGGPVLARRSRGLRPHTATKAPSQPVARRTSGPISLLRIVLVNCALNSLFFAVLLLLPGDVFFPPNTPTNRAAELSASGGHVAFWFFLAFGLARQVWRPRLPYLRTLPVATWHLNAIFLATAVANWLGMWITLELLHVVVPVRVADILRPDLIAGLIGVSALADAYGLQSHWAVRGAMIAVGVVTMVAAVRYLGHTADTVWLPSLLFGAAAVAAAAWLNHHALTRSNSIYRTRTSELSFAS
jgi:hypothetical protein